MIGGLTLYLWILVPSALFALFIGYVVVAGHRTRKVALRGLARSMVRPGRSSLINVIRPRPAATDVATVLETAPVAHGPQRAQG